MGPMAISIYVPWSITVVTASYGTTSSCRREIWMIDVVARINDAHFDILSVYVRDIQRVNSVDSIWSDLSGWVNLGICNDD